ncbi:fungal transcription factor [Colletotrichum asianum]
MRSPTFTWLFAALPVATALPNTTVEVDLLFPRENTTYTLNSTGIPVLLSIHNPSTANAYGWTFYWETFKQPHPDLDWRLPVNNISAQFGNTTRWPDNPHLITDTTGPLEAGTYTFHWNLQGGPWCKFEPGFGNSSGIALPVGGGSFEFLVADETEAAPVLAGVCGEVAGMMDYASTTTFAHDGIPGMGGHTVTCGVTRSVTATAESCKATLDEGQARSVSSLMGWGEFATASATTTPTSTGVTGSSEGRAVSVPVRLLSLMIAYMLVHIV